MVKFAKVIIGNTDLVTAQAFVYPTTNLNLSVLISASGDDVFTKVRQTIADLELKFFEADGSIPDRINLAKSFLTQQLSEFENLEIQLCVWQESVLYIDSFGEHKAYLLRDGEITDLTPTVNGLPAEDTNDRSSRLVSGHIKSKDKLLFITKSFANYLALNQQNVADVISLVIGSTLDRFEEDLNSILPAKDFTEPVAAILLEFESSAKDLPGIPQLKSNLEEGVVASRFPTKKVLSVIIDYIPKNRKFKIGLTILLVTLIILVGIYTRYSGKSPKKITTDHSFLDQARDLYSKVLSEKDIDSAQAKKDLESAKVELSKALELNPTDESVQKLKEEINVVEKELLKEYAITEWPIFLNLDLIKTGFMTKKLSVSLGKALLLDSQTKSLVLIDLKTKNSRILSGQEQLGDAKYAAINGGFGFVYSPNKGVVRVDIQSQKVINAVKTDDEWGDIVDIFGFGGNVYLLDKLKNNIWKYTPIQSGYSDKASYIKTPIAELTLPTKFQIDSAVWVLTDNGISKLTLGKKDNFTTTSKIPSGISVFFVSDETENIYFIDANNLSMLVFDKNGVYQARYSGDKFKTADDMFVNEMDKKLYLLEGSKIYQAEIK